MRRFRMIQYSTSGYLTSCQLTDSAFPRVVRFSKEIPKVDNQSIAVKTKVGSPCKDFMVDASRIGAEFKAVAVAMVRDPGCIRMEK